jgi:hypothetical protein
MKKSGIIVLLFLIANISCRKKGTVSGHVVHYTTGAPIEGVKILVQQYHIIGTGDFGIEKQKFVESATSDSNGEFTLDMKYRRRDKFEYRVFIEQNYLPVPDSDVDVFYFLKSPQEPYQLLEKTKKDEMTIELRPSGRLRLICTDVPPLEEYYEVTASARDDLNQNWSIFGTANSTEYQRVATDGIVYIKIEVSSGVYVPPMFDTIILPPFAKATYSYNY